MVGIHGVSVGSGCCWYKNSGELRPNVFWCSYLPIFTGSNRGSKNSASHAGHLVLHCWNIAGPNENQLDQKKKYWPLRVTCIV